MVIDSVSRTALAAALALGAAPAFAQTPAPAPAPTAAPAPADAPAAAPVAQGTRVYTPADFARFAPANALDMLRNVPGFTIREQAQERGIGEATANVVLNGQRISGKSDEITAQLSRIPAQNVVRIEIVDGASLEIPGLSGQVANIIAQSRSRGVNGQFSWSPEVRAHSAPPLWTRFDASVSGENGPVEWTLGIDNSTGRGGAAGPTWIMAPNGVITEYRDDVFSGRNERPRVSSRFKIDGPGSSIGNLSGSYRWIFGEFTERSFRTGPGLVDRERILTSEDGGHSWEIGGDYEFALAGGRLKLIGLNRSSNSPFESDVVIRFADRSPDGGDRFARSGVQNERIGRVEYRWRGLGGDLQLSGESAFNRLDSVSRYFVREAGGGLREIPLPGGSARITEDRYEVMASYGRSFAPNFSIQLSAGGEYSQLSHISGGTATRSFWRPKGQLTAVWRPEPNLDLNFRLQRRVGQLNFYDFLASVNLGEDRRNAGNAELVPPQTWEAEVEAVRRLGPWGTTSLRLYGHLIDDIIDIIPIGATGESPGNIDRAIRFGGDWKSTINLDGSGLRGMRLDTRVQLQHSRLRDPLTGERRPISNSLQYLANFELRHDVPDTDWAWGAGAYYQRAALNYRLTEVGRFWEGPVWANLYLEHKDVLGLTVRATLGNIFGGDSMWDRTVYAGRRTGPIAFFERRDRFIGPIYSLSIRGRF